MDSTNIHYIHVQHLYNHMHNTVFTNTNIVSKYNVLTDSVTSAKLPLFDMIEVRVYTQFKFHQIHLHFAVLRVQSILNHLPVVDQ